MNLFGGFGFPFQNKLGHSKRCIPNLKTLAFIGAKKSVTENVIGEKEKWTNKGNDRQEETDSLFAQYSR